MGILSSFIIAGLVFGNSYLLFQGQMRNIGLLKTLAVLMVVPFPLNVLFVFGSKYKDGKNGICAHMASSFHKDFFRNVLLSPFRVLTYAGSSLWAKITSSPVDPKDVMASSFGRLYSDAAADLAKEQAEQERRVELEAGADEALSERQEELTRKEAELEARERFIKERELDFASKFFSDCPRIGDSFEIKGVELPDGSMIFSAPEVYRSSVEESLRAYFAADGDSRSFRVVGRDDFPFEVGKSEGGILASAGDSPIIEDYQYDGIETSDGKRFVGVSEGNVSKVQASLDRLGIDAKVVSEKKLASLKTEHAGAYSEFKPGSFSYARSLHRDCSLYFTPTEKTVTTREALLGAQVSGREFRDSCSRVDSFVETLRTGLSERGVRGLLKGDTPYFDHGLQLESGKDCVKLIYGDGVPYYLGEVRFNPENGEGKEFEVSLDGLKKVLEMDGFSSKDAEAVKRALEYGFGEKFESTEKLMSRMETMRGPELSDVWCNSVKEPNNLAVLFEQQTLTGFQAVEHNAKVDEAQKRVQQEQQKITVENYQKVKVGPSLS